MVLLARFRASHWRRRARLNMVSSASLIWVPWLVAISGPGFTVEAVLGLGRAVLPGGVAEPVLVYRGRVYGLGEWGYSDVREVMLEVGPEELEGLARVVSSSDRGLPLSAVRLLAPVDKPEKIICIGVNYRAHARESGVELPGTPNLFVKTGNSIVGPGDPVVVHSVGLKLDGEVELAAVIGIPARSIPPSEAPDVVWGFMVLNDVTSRLEQRELGISQWWRAKSHDTYAPTGPIIVPRHMVSIGDTELELVVDGIVARRGNTGDMVHSVWDIVSVASTSALLVPGDIICTGTPAGTMPDGKPAKTPEPGSVMRACARGIGCIENRVVLDEELCPHGGL
ncbi:Fumarylacetoacetate (FAA) hydrolase [Hyperthermus butylicus DSM 5456]|uniref:Fumarylacetoacetate (FAA) hydrolase n=1 Tax=Hyperthermus butylicus (strain DSM 5456 / JCM 9403 / PLM1-5) TaxID=415426 RepID=A2BJD1_HYPBU|nr:Fumarylacetoacetate (FAA) hydrolase [Hyperthermus butylicus DSM 5456]